MKRAGGRTYSSSFQWTAIWASVKPCFLARGLVSVRFFLGVFLTGVTPLEINTALRERLHARSGAFPDDKARQATGLAVPSLRRRIMLPRDFRRQLGVGLAPGWTSSQMRVPCVSLSSRLPTTSVMAATTMG